MSIVTAQWLLRKLGVEAYMVTMVRGGNETGALLVEAGKDAKIARMIAYMWHMEAETAENHTVLYGTKF